MNWIDWLRIVVEVIVVIITFFAGKKKERSRITKALTSARFRSETDIQGIPYARIIDVLRVHRRHVHKERPL